MSPFDGPATILNFRDIGHTINKISRSKILREGILFRSARPDDASSEDRTSLKSDHNIKTILDLRSKTEHINAGRQHSNVASLPPAVPDPSSPPVDVEPLKIPGINYEEINLNGPGFEKVLLWKLSWSSLSKLLYLMARGYRDDAIRILGREVMRPRGLVGLGMDTLDHSQREIKQVFRVLARASTYPLLIHCTQGKDRTGLIVLLTLLLCGVNEDAISSDYLMSEPALESEKKQRLEHLANTGLDESFAGCPPDFVQTMVEHINKRYGGITAYLAKIGVGPELQQNVKQVLEQT